MNPVTGRLSIGVKLTMLSSVLVVLSFAVFTYVAISSMTRASDEKSMAMLSAQTDQVLETMAVYDASLRSSAELASRVLGARFPESFRLDTTSSVNVGGTDTPVLKSGDKVVNNDLAVVDQFTTDTGAVATVFVRKGDDFVRVATSVKKQDGVRALGTLLERGHPAYDKLLAGEVFTGKARLFGKDYMTRYVPVRDAAGKVVAALYTGSDFTDGLKALTASIKAMKSGETGYFFALDAAPGGDLGTLTIHPAKEGQSILGAKDGDGREFIREILAKKKGVIRYPWLNTEIGETTAREKIVVYGHFEAWNWVVAGGTYVEEFSRATVRLRNTLLACAIAAVVLLSSLLYWAFRRMISAPLKHAVAIATRVGAGDLTSRVEVESADEVGQLMQALQNMNTSLTKIVSEVRTGTDAISTGSEEIAAGNADLARRTEQQSASLEETAASMEELTGTVKQNASTAEQAHQLATAASAVAARGGEAVGKVVRTMSSIHESSKRIADIIGVMDEIAFQTNILALNAAVEAARAGAEGRGFAVVATEVQMLARRSSSAAKEINGLISESVTTVKDGARFVDEARNTMVEIVTSVKRVNTLMADISAASAEQSTGIEQVNQAMMQMDEMTQQNAALVEEAAAATEAMLEQAQRLGDAVAVFKVGEEAAVGPEPRREERREQPRAANRRLTLASQT